MTDPTEPYDPTVNDWSTRYDVAENPLRHGIDESVPGGAFASVRQPAWHRLGYVAETQVSASELLGLGGADFPIFRGPITTRIEVPIAPGSPITVFKEATDPRRYCICRLHPTTQDLEVLGQASDGYPLWTPRDVLVGFGDAIMAYGEPTVSTCGALDAGRRVFMSFKMPQDIRPAGMADESVQLWVVVTTSFDQSAPTIAMVTPIRAVCQNTLRVGALEALGKYVVRKTRNARLQEAQARTALGLIEPVARTFEAEADAMLSVRITNERFRLIMEEEFGPGEEPTNRQVTTWEKKLETLTTLFSTADTQANVRNTGYGMYNAVAEFCDWEARIKKGLDPLGDRFSRALAGEKSITDPKRAIRARVLEMAK